MTEPIIDVSVAQVRRYRLLRNGLLASFASPTTAAAALMGVQAQIEPAAGLALWNRTTGLTESHFEALLYQKRSLVKLWGQRGTLHLYPSAEWPLVHSMLAANQTWWGRTAEREERLDEYSELVEQAAEILRRRTVMGRRDLRASDIKLDDEHLSPWGGVFSDLVRRGYACHAGRIGGEGVFAAREVWLPDLDWQPPPPEAANVEAARRFLHTFGPSTQQDFIYWRGSRGGLGRQWWATLAKDTVEVSVEGRPMWILREDLADLLAPPDELAGHVRMLGRFEPMLLGQKENSWIIAPHADKRVIRPAGHIEAIVLAEGQAVATWRYARKGRGLGITVDRFPEWRARFRRPVERVAQQVAVFFEMPLVALEGVR